MSGTRWATKRSCSRQLTIYEDRRSATNHALLGLPRISSTWFLCSEEVRGKWIVSSFHNIPIFEFCDEFWIQHRQVNKGSPGWYRRSWVFFRILLEHAPATFRVVRNGCSRDAREFGHRSTLFYHGGGHRRLDFRRFELHIVFLNQRCSWYINHCRKGTRNRGREVELSAWNTHLLNMLVSVCGGFI